MIKTRNSNSAKCNIINKLPLLKEYCTEEQKSLLKKSNICFHYKKDDVIFHENFPLSHIGVVVSGVIGIWKEINISEKCFICFLKEGNFFGLRSIAEHNNVYYYSSIALVDTTVCLIEKENYDKFLLENNEFRLTTTLNYIKRLEKNEIQFSRLVNMNATQRVAYALLKIYNVFYKTPYNISIPRKLLVDLSNVSLGNTIRIVAKFRKDNIISTQGSKITFNHPNRLKEIVSNY